MLSVYAKTQTGDIFSSLWLEEHFRDGLVWTVDLTVEFSKAAFLNSFGVLWMGPHTPKWYNEK